MSLDPQLEGRETSRETLMKRRSPAIGGEALATEIASLSKLDTDELRARWKAMFWNPAVARYQPVFLTRAIAYRLQEKAFGGLKPSTQRRLAEFACDGANGSDAQRASVGMIANKSLESETHRRSEFEFELTGDLCSGL